jgi:cholesterol oxidase
VAPYDYDVIVIGSGFGTITAQAERAMAFWPNKGAPDPRPELGDAYRRIAAVAPAHPTVPEAARGALRLPLLIT